MKSPQNRNNDEKWLWIGGEEDKIFLIKWTNNTDETHVLHVRVFRIVERPHGIVILIYSIRIQMNMRQKSNKLNGASLAMAQSLSST